MFHCLLNQALFIYAEIWNKNIETNSETNFSTLQSETDMNQKPVWQNRFVLIRILNLLFIVIGPTLPVCTVGWANFACMYSRLGQLTSVISIHQPSFGSELISSDLDPAKLFWSFRSESVIWIFLKRIEPPNWNECYKTTSKPGSFMPVTFTAFLQ